MTKLGKKDMQNIVTGAGLFGSGGGGSIAEGMKLVEKILEFDNGVELVSVNEVPDDKWGVVIAGVGSPRASLTKVRTYSPTYALELLEEAKGFKCSFVIPFELGAGNSLNPMLAAVQRKIPIVDGDPAGRAVPEIQMNTFYLGGIPLSPLALATEDKISAVIRTEKPYDTERVARAITSELGGVSAIACHSMLSKDIKKYIIAGTTTLVKKIGAEIRQMQNQGEDVAEGLIKNFKGYLLGKGKVSSVRGETKGGFDFGTVEVMGKLPIKVMFQNENMLAFRKEKLLAVVPDLICSIDEKGNPLTNADIKEGMEITYLGFAAHSSFRTPDVFNLFTEILKALGYQYGFIPIKELA